MVRAVTPLMLKRMCVAPRRLSTLELFVFELLVKLVSRGQTQEPETSVSKSVVYRTLWSARVGRTLITLSLPGDLLAEPLQHFGVVQGVCERDFVPVEREWLGFSEGGTCAQLPA